VRHYDEHDRLVLDPVANDDSDNESLCAPAVADSQRAGKQEAFDGDNSDPASDIKENPDDVEPPDKHMERRRIYNEEKQKLVRTKKQFVVKSRGSKETWVWHIIEDSEPEEFSPEFELFGTSG
jgi:hypothetical protein